MARLPDGTITFLYTDIEGSTPLWDQKPRAMSVSQELHNKLLHRTISEHQGQVFKVIGDAFQAVFVIPSMSKHLTRQPHNPIPYTSKHLSCCATHQRRLQQTARIAEQAFISPLADLR